LNQGDINMKVSRSTLDIRERIVVDLMMLVACCTLDKHLT